MNNNQDIPCQSNFCGGNFQDWLEVNLTDKCNAKCPWCIERSGFHPTYHAPWEVIADAALTSRKKNIILLGGEPTLHPDLKKIIHKLYKADRLVWITTNGSRLTIPWIFENLLGVCGVNISIHHYLLEYNKEITNICLDRYVVREMIFALHQMHISVRLNCNCIKNYIDTRNSILCYIEFAKEVGADKVRFAELKGDEGNFVDLAKILDYEYGLNDDPFKLGCNKDVVINDMPVNFRQMCGLQTCFRKRPLNPVQCKKQVLYYDGIIYNGWQQIKKNKGEEAMDAKRLVKILEDVKSGEVSVAEAAIEIDRVINRKVEAPLNTPPKTELEDTGCVY